MDWFHRLPYDIFDSDWENLGYLDTPQPCNLTSRIHPIFTKIRGQEKIRAFTGSDEEYERILPAVRLASNYLYSPSSRVFICSIVHAEREPTGLKDIFSNPLFQFDKLDPSLCSSDRIDQIWARLALHTEFGPQAMYRWNEILTIGRTNAKIDEEGIDLTGSGKMCYASKMSFNHRFLEDIEDLHLLGKAVSKEMLNVQFHLAMNLCHEVAHVVGMATKVKPLCPLSGLFLPEPFFGNETMAELGHAFVNEILGGKPLGYRWGRSRSLPLLTDWPAGEKLFGRPIPQRGDHKKNSEEFFLVDMKLMQKIFQQDFWDRIADLPKDDDKSQAIRMSKTVGFILEEHPPTNWMELSKEEAEEATKYRPKRIFRDLGRASGSS